MAGTMNMDNWTLSKCSYQLKLQSNYGLFSVTTSVPEFEATQYLVSNREFLDFVVSGSYQKRELWTEEGIYVHTCTTCTCIQCVFRMLYSLVTRGGML